MLHFFCCKDILSCKNNSGGKFSSSFLQIRWQFVTAIFPVVIIAITSLKDVCLIQPTTMDARPGMATMAFAMPTRAWQKFPGGKPWKLRYWRHPLTNQITGKSVPTNRRSVYQYCFHSLFIYLLAWQEDFPILNLSCFLDPVVFGVNGKLGYDIIQNYNENLYWIYVHYIHAQSQKTGQF